MIDCNCFWVGHWLFHRTVPSFLQFCFGSVNWLFHRTVPAFQSYLMGNIYLNAVLAVADARIPSSNKFCGLSHLHPCATGWLPARCATLLFSWGHRPSRQLSFMLLCRSHRTVPSFFWYLILFGKSFRSYCLGCYFAVYIGPYLLSVDLFDQTVLVVTLQLPSDCTFFR